MPHALSDMYCNRVRPAYLAPGLQAPWRLLRQLPARVRECLSRASFGFRFQIPDYSLPFSCALTPRHSKVSHHSIDMRCDGAQCVEKRRNLNLAKDACAFAAAASISFRSSSGSSQTSGSQAIPTYPTSCALGCVTCRSSSAPVGTALSTLQWLSSSALTAASWLNNAEPGSSAKPPHEAHLHA